MKSLGGTLITEVTNVFGISHKNGVFPDVNRVVPHSLETAHHEDEMENLFDLSRLAIHPFRKFADDVTVGFVKIPITGIERQRQLSVPFGVGLYRIAEEPKCFLIDRLDQHHFSDLRML